MPGNITAQEMNQMVQQKGLRAVQQWLKETGTTIDGMAVDTGGAELPASTDTQPLVYPNASPASPFMVNPPQAGTTDMANPLSVRGPYDEQAAGLAQTRSQQEQAQYDAFRSQMADPMYYLYSQKKAAEDELKRRYASLYPTDKSSPEYKQAQQEKWFNIASQFLRPTASSSFGESLANVTDYLGSQSEAQRKAREELNQELFSLAKTYDVGIANTAADLIKAREAAGKPSLSMSSSGDWSIKPGTGGVPPINGKGQYVVSTEQDAANVPTGKQFVFAGDKTGKVYYGR